MDILIAALHAAVIYKMLVMLLLMGAVASAVVLIEPRGVWLWTLAAMTLMAAASLFWGHRLMGALLVRYGGAGIGTVSAIEGTSHRHSGQPPLARFRIQIRSDDGRTLESGFDSIDLVTYPALHRGAALPQPGVEFSVRLLPSHPHVFAIVTDDDSAYARRLRCIERTDAMKLSRHKYDFTQDFADYRPTYADTQATHEATGCRDHAVSTPPGAGRNTWGSLRQAHTAR